MDFEVLTELRNTVSNYQPLIDFAYLEFEKNFNHFIGNKLRTKAKPSDYPFFSYYPQYEEFLQKTNIEIKENSQIAIQYAIKNDNEEDGTRQIVQIKNLLIECLKQNHRLNGLVLNIQPKRFETDEGYFQPYFFARLLIQAEEIK